MERFVCFEMQFILSFQPRTRNIVHTRPERLGSRLFVQNTALNTLLLPGKKMKKGRPFWGRPHSPHSVLELRKEIAPETVEFA